MARAGRGSVLPALDDYHWVTFLPRLEEDCVVNRVAVATMRRRGDLRASCPYSHSRNFCEDA